MSNERFATYNVVAEFHDAPAAQEAMAALEGTGVPSSKVSLVSDRADEAVAEAEVQQDSAELVRNLRRGVVVGAVLGAIVGAALGLLFLGVLVGFDPKWVTAIGPGAGGLVLGGVIAGRRQFSRTRQRDAAREGRVLVGVHTDDPQEVERATTVLRQGRAARVNLFDKAGRKQPS